MFLNAITDRTLFPGDEAARRAGLLRQVNEWAQDARVSVIQVREKDLPDDQLLELARLVAEVATRRQPVGSAVTLVVVNGPIHVARDAGATGIHFPSRASRGASLAALLQETRAAWDGQMPYVSVACHSLDEVREAAALEVAQIVFSPVFEKPLRDAASLQGAGLPALSAACRVAAPAKVLALGGITAENAQACVDAGAGGVAGIRLFMGDQWQRLA